jgi:predicted RNA-binding Zn-ribbon protein involved in translation (DUF1610 family)
MIQANLGCQWVMAAKKDVNQMGESAVTVTTRDIMFECPSCGKSLVVDEAAAGLIVDCPQCRINVIVPPKSTPAGPPQTQSPQAAATSKPAFPPKEAKSGGGDAGNLKERLTSLGNQLKELQTQRTEINNRIAARLNELNRDLVLLARVETSQQQILSEWQQVIGKLSTVLTSDQTPAVIGSSVGGHTRVQFDH